jgi:hypothetical protein
VKDLLQIAAGIAGLFVILSALVWLNDQPGGSTILWLGAVAVAGVVGYWTGERQARRKQS